MSRSIRRGVLAATAIVFSIVSVTACSAGQNAASLEIKPENAFTSLGNIRLQNVTVLTQSQSGAQGSAVVSATLFNNGSRDETLRGIQLPGTDATVKLTPANGSGQVTIPANGFVILGGEGNASAVIQNGRAVAEDLGGTREVVFQLSETGDVKLNAIVTLATGYFEGYGPSQRPKEPTGSPTGSPTRSPAQDAGAPAGSTQSPPAPMDTASASLSRGR
ncbi:DUF461 domain-containing protein [Streptomyces ficellus]|uniref:DUF461 domain-containing protein n=1 Tax=Streptomyces ficellus TaxID=1977088 RepID=A0ABT7ZBE6_9ACTN|nr:DUF461 domain-containing protein [Streptomyces ficellus]MDN3296366.1 DUF461 domain-containing protein [Streptomyces ficellus]